MMTQERSHHSEPALPLSMCSAGDQVVIIQTRGGRKLKSRLNDLGLNPGAEIRVVKNNLPGPLIIAVKEDSRLALGRGMVQNILVAKSVQENDDKNNSPGR